MSAIKRILCPVDFSEPSTYAAKRAVELSRDLNAELTFLHVIDEGKYFLEATSHAHSYQFEDYAREVKAKLVSLAKELCEPATDTAEVQVLEGRAYAVIVDTASKMNADLIVMGTHGRSGLPHMLLGSVAERVVRTAKVPVLTVRKPEA